MPAIDDGNDCENPLRAYGQKRSMDDAAGDDEIFGRVVSIRNLIFFSNFEPIDPAVCWKFPLLPIPIPHTHSHTYDKPIQRGPRFLYPYPLRETAHILCKT